MWKGAVSFGLVNVPVKMYTATESHDLSFHQVHRTDGGQIRYKRACDVCGEQVAYDDIATPGYWVRQVRQPVRFADALTHLTQAGATTFLELGPDAVLTALGPACLPDGSAVVVQRGWTASDVADPTRAPQVATAAGPVLRTEPLGALPLKGKGELPVYRCLGA